MALKHKYVAEDHEGKLYRVRDKDFGKGQPVIVWGENLSHEQAHALKERVCGAERSQTARIEDMEIPAPATAVTPKGEPLSGSPVRHAVDPGGLVLPSTPAPADPVIAAAREKAMAAARGAAAQARARAVEPQPTPVPVEDLTVPDNIEAELDDLMADGGDASSLD